MSSKKLTTAVTTKINIAVVTGDHSFQEAEFDAIFKNMAEVAFVRQDLARFVEDPNQKLYESVVFYNFNQKNPDPRTAEAILSLAERGQGLVMLHHAILAFPKWAEFASICGIKDRRFGYHDGQRLKIHVADVSHPITSGIAGWDMADETYTMKDPGSDSHILLTTDHPKSMKVIGWVHTYRNSRVFCFQSGHDSKTYSVPQFREILTRGIRWVARCI